MSTPADQAAGVRVQTRSADGLAGGRARRPLAWMTGLLVIASTVLALACSRHGAAIGGDSVVYLLGARNILAGDGYSWIGPEADVRPISLFGPLFPAALSSLGLVGLGDLAAARLLNAVLFGVNTCLVVAVVKRVFRQEWLSAVAALLFVFYPPVLALHTEVVAEPLFLCLVLTEILALTEARHSGSSRWALLAGTAAGAAYLARFAGLAFAGAGLMALVVRRGAGWRLRLRQAIPFGLAAGIPIAAWLLRNHLLAGTAAQRSLEFAAPDASLAALVAELVSYWFLPDRIPLAFRAPAAVLLGGVLAAAWLRARRRAEAGQASAWDEGGGAALLAVLAWGIAGYAAQLATARLLLTPRISLDQRILAPIWLLTVLLALAAAGEIRRRSPSGAGVWVGAVLLVLSASYLVRGTMRAIELQTDGRGFAGRAWRSSPLINALSLLPPDTPIYTNEVEALYLLADRRVYRLPTGCLPIDALHVEPAGTDCRTPEYRVWRDNMRRALADEMAVLAVFNTFAEVSYYAPVVPELIEGLDVLTTQGDGRLYVQDRSEWPENPNW